VIRSASGLTHLFPTPAQLFGADLCVAGFTPARAETLRSLAKAVSDGAIDWHAAPELVAHALTSLPGVSQWTAQYVALRALGEPDAFPASDLTLRRIAAGRDGSPLSAQALEQRARPWRPWRGYATMYLWDPDTLEVTAQERPAARRAIS
jgi:AraC family transcriptional regulator of adaptative response / DNA-3-methyladenine glycosylase II